jgi:3-methyl-2-oxobutanoate hydroxymethyltransferase
MKIQREEHRLLADARAAQEAGAFGVLLELIPRAVAAQITRELHVPTIGIGAGPDCDGQVLVSYDMLGLTDDFHPKFVKRFAELRSEATRAVQQYIADIRSGKFPDDRHSHN